MLLCLAFTVHVLYLCYMISLLMSVSFYHQIYFIVTILPLLPVRCFNIVLPSELNFGSCLLSHMHLINEIGTVVLLFLAIAYPISVWASGQKRAKTCSDGMHSSTFCCEIVCCIDTLLLSFFCPLIFRVFLMLLYFKALTLRDYQGPLSV